MLPHPRTGPLTGYYLSNTLDHSIHSIGNGKAKRCTVKKGYIRWVNSQ
jgi:hypothetical protein